MFKTSGNSNPIVWDEVWNVNAGGAHTHSTTAAGTGATGAAGTGATGAAGTGATGTVSAWHTHSGTTSGISANHTHSGTTGGISANHTHSVTASGTNASTGGGGSHICARTTRWVMVFQRMSVMWCMSRLTTTSPP